MTGIYLVIAGLTAIAWAIGLKYTGGFSRLWPGAGTISGMIQSFILPAQAPKTMPAGTEYAVWTGIASVGTAILGIKIFGEAREVGKIVCIAFLVAGMVGLKLLLQQPEVG